MKHKSPISHVAYLFIALKHTEICYELYYIQVVSL